MLRKSRFSVIIFSIVLFFCFCQTSYAATPIYLNKRKVLKKGLAKEKIFRYFPQKIIRTLTHHDSQEQITIDYRDANADVQLITLIFEDNVLTDWIINDRELIIQSYLEEFAGPDFKAYPNIYNAIVGALKKLPWDVFLKVTDRAHPVIFTEYHTSGMSRIANSSEYLNEEGSPPAFTKGIYILKLSSELEAAAEQLAVEGIILHELAHRALDHLQQEEYTRELEREANHVIMDWGYKEEFEKAKKYFGSQ
ncbi:MAG: hypothetical protein H6755_05500 [Candidatus Omnitrophica bacterium]|nr:hypothetical protein [Candidatus Omnitrophota bacterium]MCB9747847.1 hypothetical protein [Candidatus Omnitrophota bacterium]